MKYVHAYGERRKQKVDTASEIQSISVIRPPGYRAKPVIGPVLVWYGSS